MEVNDQFKDWDTFMRHFELTRDLNKALRWTAFEKWANKRQMKRLALRARLLATRSMLLTDGGVLKNGT